MDEVLNPAHGISWGAIVFVAGGSYLLIKILDRTVREHGKILAELSLTLKEMSTLLKRCIEDLREITNDTDNLKETTSQHRAWAAAKAESIDEHINGIVQRLARLEGRVFEGGNYGSSGTGSRPSNSD